MGIIYLNNSNFKSEVLNDTSIVLVDFWADWCGPCQMLTPVIRELSSELRDVKVCKVNVDKNRELVKEYNIMSIPTLMIFKNGELKERNYGFRTKEEIIEMIDAIR